MVLRFRMMCFQVHFPIWPGSVTFIYWKSCALLYDDKILRFKRNGLWWWKQQYNLQLSIYTQNYRWQNSKAWILHSLFLNVGFPQWRMKKILPWRTLQPPHSPCLAGRGEWGVVGECVRAVPAQPPSPLILTRHTYTILHCSNPTLRKRRHTFLFCHL